MMGGLVRYPRCGATAIRLRRCSAYPRALTDTTVAGAVGNSLFADLVSVARHLYKYGIQDDPTSTLTTTTLNLPAISMQADEFNELIGDEFVPLLNKAGGAGFQLTAYTQTWSDVEARVGSQARAGQIAGNFNTLVMLRVKELATAVIGCPTGHAAGLYANPRVRRGRDAGYAAVLGSPRGPDARDAGASAVWHDRAGRRPGTHGSKALGWRAGESVRLPLGQEGRATVAGGDQGRLFGVAVQSAPDLGSGTFGCALRVQRHGDCGYVQEVPVNLP